MSDRKSKSLIMRMISLDSAHKFIEGMSKDTYIIVDTFRDGVSVPMSHISNDGTITLNITHRCLRPGSYDLTPESLKFDCRFNGVEMNITVPLNAIMCVFCKDDPALSIVWETWDFDKADTKPKAVKTERRLFDVTHIENISGKLNGGAPIGHKGWNRS